MAKVARAMETRVDRMKRELVEVQKGGKRVKVAFPQPIPSGRVPLGAAGIAKAFGDNVVFVDIEFRSRARRANASDRPQRCGKDHSAPHSCRSRDRRSW